MAKKGIIIGDDNDHKIIDFVKVHIGYNELKSKDKVKEITIDESCNRLMRASV